MTNKIVFYPVPARNSLDALKQVVPVSDDIVKMCECSERLICLFACLCVVCGIEPSPIEC